MLSGVLAPKFLGRAAPRPAALRCSLYRSLPSSLHVLRPLAFAFRLFFRIGHVLTTYFREGFSLGLRLAQLRCAALCIARFLARCMFSDLSLLRLGLPLDLSLLR